MSTGRVLWIIWCAWWAGVWAAVGVVLGGDHALQSSAGAKVLPWLLALGSLGALLLPVGKERMHAPPPDQPVWRNPRA